MVRTYGTLRILAFLLIFMGWDAPTFAAPTSLTYQGRIVKSDGQPLQNNSVSFQFEITTPNGACVLYREQVNGINMTDSNGVFDVQIGASHSYPATPSFTILDSFNNSNPLTCDGGATFNPTLSDGRLLKVQFHDGSSWRQITPSSAIRSVPFAGYSESAAKLGDNLPTDFVRKIDVNGNVSCGAGSFLTWNATTKSFGCASGAAGTGTVTNLTSANSYLVITNSSTTPTLTVNVGTVANTVAAGNDPRLSDSRNPTGGATGDLTGNYPNPTVSKIQNVGVDATAPTSGQVLKFNGTNWAAATLPAGNNGTVTSVTAGTGLTGGSITTSGTIGLGTELAAIHALSGTGLMTRSGSGSYTTSAASPLASANTIVQRDASGISGFNGIDITGATSGTLSLLVPTITTSYSLTFPNAQGGANQVLKNNGAGILSWAAVPTAPGANCGTNEVLTYTGGAFACVPDQTGSAGTGITSINGESGSSQSFGSINTAGTSLSWTSASSVHTLNIPLAGTTGVTAGLISKAEYDAFNAKQAALGYTPLRPSNNLNDVANVGTARTNLGLGTAATHNVPASGNAASGEVVLGNDTRLADIANKVGKSQIAECTSGQTLSYVSANDTWSCQNIVVTDAQITYGSKTANTFLAAPNGSNGAPTFRTIASSDLPSTITDAMWSASGGNINRATGNVGIGVPNPTMNFEVAGNAWIHGNIYASNIGVTSSLSSSGGTAGYWGRLAKIDFNQRYQYYTGQFILASRYAGHGIAFLNIRQEAAMGSAPDINLQLDHSTSTLSKTEIVAITTVNSASQTTVELWFHTLADYELLNYQPAANGGWIVSQDYTPGTLVTSLPAGVQTAATAGTSLWNLAANGNDMSYSRGNVGIGTTSPTEKLEVVGKVKASELCIGTDCRATWPTSGGGGSVTSVTAGTGLATTPSGGITGTGSIGISAGGVSSTELASNSVDSGKIVDGSVSIADLNVTGTMAVNAGLLVHDGTQFFSKTCSGNQTLIWTVANGWTCNTIVMTESDPKVGSNTTNYLSKWNGSALVNSGVIELSSNVGIGVASPAQKLSVGGIIQSTTGGIMFPDGTTQITAATTSALRRATVVYTGAGISVPTATDTNVSFTSASVDTSSFWSAATPTRLTVPTGVTKIRLCGNVTLAGPLTSVWTFKSTVKKNGSFTAGSGLPVTAVHTTYNSNLSVPFCSITLDVTAGDYFEIAAYQNSGSTATIGTSSTYFSIEEVAGNAGGGGSADNLGSHTATQNLNLSSFQLVGNGGSSGIAITSSGSVGIGTTTPTAKLEITGTAGVDGIKFPDGSVQTSAAVSSGTNNSMLTGWPDAIQCSITNPAYGVRTLYLNTAGYQSKHWYVEPLSAGNGSYEGWVTYNSSDGSFSSSGAGYTTHNCNIAISAITAAGRSFNFVKGPAAQWLQSGSNAYYNAGNVGVGTASPSSPLTVAGTIESTSGGIKFPDGTTQTSAAGSAYYYGETTTATLNWPANVWTDVTSLVALSDRLNSGITRSGSAFTFGQTGIYRVNASFNAHGVSNYLGLRLRRTSGTAATLAQRTNFNTNDTSGGGGNFIISALISVTAGDIVNLQYIVKNGTIQTWGSSNPLDGESMVTGDVSIEKIK